jgi:hypothetical protein
MDLLIISILGFFICFKYQIFAEAARKCTKTPTLSCHPVYFVQFQDVVWQAAAYR